MTQETFQIVLRNRPSAEHIKNLIFKIYLTFFKKGKKTQLNGCLMRSPFKNKMFLTTSNKLYIFKPYNGGSICNGSMRKTDRLLALFKTLHGKPSMERRS